MIDVQVMPTDVVGTWEVTARNGASGQPWTDRVQPAVDRDRRRVLLALQSLYVDVDVEGVEATLRQAAAEDAEQQKSRRGSHGGRTKGETKSTKLIRLALETATLFHTPDGTAYADLIVDGHRETHGVRSTTFRRHLERMFFNAEDSAPGAQAVADATGTLEAVALFDGAERPVCMRIAASDQQTIIDLGDPTWRAIVVDADGWRIVQEPPVRFRRCRGMLPMPEPITGGSVEELRPFLSGTVGDNFVLIVAWLVAALAGRKPFPVAVLQGEQGSGKSTLATLLRALVDPSTVPHRAAPREERDLAVHANNAWLVAFDNLSHLPEWLSDALCRVSTGGGFGTRQLYSDADETLFDGTRPVLINGISALAQRPDFGDRCIIFELPPIPPGERRTEADFWHEFYDARPRILGALLDGVARALRDFGAVQLAELPRLADFAQLITAAESAFGWVPGTFAEAYARAGEARIEVELSSDPVAVAVRELLDKRRDETLPDKHGRRTVEMTPTKLHAALDVLVSDSIRRSPAWPSTPSALGNRLRRLVPVLRKVGVDVGFAKSDNRRVVTIWEGGA